MAKRRAMSSGQASQVKKRGHEKEKNFCKFNWSR